MPTDADEDEIEISAGAVASSPLAGRIIVTHHAVQQYIDRIEADATPDSARSTIATSMLTATCLPETTVRGDAYYSSAAESPPPPFLMIVESRDGLLVVCTVLVPWHPYTRLTPRRVGGGSGDASYRSKDRDRDRERARRGRREGHHGNPRGGRRT